MAITYSDPELLRTDDPRYRAHQSLYARWSRLTSGGLKRATPPRSQLGRIVERGARSLLGERRWLSDRRVLAYNQQEPGKNSERRYREIDAVAMDVDGVNAEAFIEIKSSVSPLRALRKATLQLRTLAQIVHETRWGRHVRLAAILVVPDTAEVPNKIDNGLIIKDLNEMAEIAWPIGIPAVLFVPRSTPWKRAVERGWVDDEGLLQRVKQLEAGVVSKSLIYSSGEFDGDSAFAVALRSALNGGND